jgi:hypothetical protein
VLRLLEDCHEEYNGPLFWKQPMGATYRQLAAIAYAWGMTKAQRARWIRIAESLSLSARHASHILERVQREKAA